MRMNGGTRQILIALLVILAACDRTAEPDGADDTGAIDRGVFGDPYRVVGNYNQADPELYPLLEGDTLTVRVTYAGGCETHELDVDHEVRDDTGFVWIRHDAHNDTCEALIEDEVRTVLPGRVTESRVIALRHPEGGPPQVLSRSPQTSP